jgi:hypothetical protein
VAAVPFRQRFVPPEASQNQDSFSLIGPSFKRLSISRPA